jgi:hypothetical protein
MTTLQPIRSRPIPIQSPQNHKRTVQNRLISTGAIAFIRIQRAANVRWPDAVLTNSGILLGLAKLAARDVLKGKTAKKPWVSVFVPY